MLAPLRIRPLLFPANRHHDGGYGPCDLPMFAAAMGLSLSSILLFYTGTSVAQAFFVTAAAFGAFSLYGYTTSRNLSAMGSF